MVELVTFNLKAGGYEVFTASNGLEALNQAREAMPDLILLDIMIPELDGLSVCEILHQLPSTAAIPVIIISGWCSEVSRSIGREMGAEDFVSKPFSTRDLMNRVKTTLDARDRKPDPMDCGH